MKLIQFLCATFLRISFANSAPSYDVAIVGAGLAGLSAARDLTAASKSVIVLEARDRVGGRVENQHLENGGVTELGAAFVGPTQDRVLALAEELGLETFLEYNIGDSVFWHNGKRQKYSSSTNSVPPLGPKALLQLGTLIVEVDSMAAQLNVEAPWTHPNATAWDSLTFQSWVSEVTNINVVQELVETATNSIWSAGPGELSLLYVLAYIAATGNETTPGTFERLFGVTDAAQEKRVVGGTGLLATGLASQLGTKVVLNAPVRAITEAGSEYTVTTDHRVVTAKHVVIAMSPPMAARIIYNPPLPAERDQLTQRMFMGALGKAIAVYETPFWRANGLTGQAVSDSGTTRTTFDVSPKDGSYGAMLGFIEGDEMRSFDSKPDADIQKAVTQDFVNYFGSQAANVTQWVFKRWDSEVYSRGGPVALGGPGTLTKYGPALTKPFGNIHFAGTESAPYWTGYMDGAIRSGERVAKEIIDSEG